MATAQGQIRPVGTRFSVRQLDGETRLAVFAGRVETTTAGGQTLPVRAGEQTRFTGRPYSPCARQSKTGRCGERGMLLARAMPLGELIGELARYRRGVLRCDPAIANLRVSGAFPVYDTDTSLRLLQSSLPVKVQRLTPWWVTVKPGRPGSRAP